MSHMPGITIKNIKALIQTIGIGKSWIRESRGNTFDALVLMLQYQVAAVKKSSMLQGCEWAAIIESDFHYIMSELMREWDVTTYTISKEKIDEIWSVLHFKINYLPWVDVSFNINVMEQDFVCLKDQDDYLISLQDSLTHFW